MFSRKDEFAPTAPRRDATGPGTGHAATVQLKGSSFAVQAANLAPGGGYDEQRAALAADGMSGSGSKLPHLDTIQASFGRHDVSHVQFHQGQRAQTANARLGSTAYASGGHVVSGGTTDLHTMAHEAAHVVQQTAGVQLKGGFGEAGDVYEQHADAVADRVVQGKSA